MLVKCRSQNLETERASDEKREKGEIPKFKIIREPQEDDMPVEFLVAEIQLPKLVSLKIQLYSIKINRFLSLS